MARARIQRRLLFSHAAVVVGTLVLASLLLDHERVGADALTPERAQRALLWGALLGAPAAFVVGWILSRGLSHTIAAMTRAARAMSDGDFAAPLPPPPDDELGDLVRALGSVRGQLAARIEELRARGARLRAILQGMDEGVALVEDGRVLVANRAFAELLGASALRGDGLLEGHTLLEAARVPELHAAVAQGATQRELEVGDRVLELRVTPLADGQHMLVLLDTTEARRLERVRRDFAANASHELRTPVAAVLAAAETLEAGAGDDPAARARFLAILTRHAHRLSRLASDLLDLSRLEAGYRPRLECVSLQPALTAVVGALRPAAEARRVALATSLPPALPQLGVERGALEQMLTNLIDNAIKYTPEGGRVDVSAEARGPDLLITVADTGPGIPREHLPRLFERFYRVDSARSRELGGTGLGLSIVRHLALAHAGEISVESEAGKGTRFLLRLPAR